MHWETPEVHSSDETGLEAIFEVVHRVRNIIRDIHDLTLEATLSAAPGKTDDGFDESTIVGVKSLDWFIGRGSKRGSIETGLVFQDAIEGLVSEVKTCIGSLLTFQVCQDSKGLGVALKAAILMHQLVQRAFPRMTKRWVT
jgi:hypothetical protein